MSFLGIGNQRWALCDAFFQGEHRVFLCLYGTTPRSCVIPQFFCEESCVDQKRSAAVLASVTVLQFMSTMLHCHFCKAGIVASGVQE